MFEKGWEGEWGEVGMKLNEWLKSQKFKRQNSHQQAICKVIIILTCSRLNTEIFDLSYWTLSRCGLYFGDQDRLTHCQVFSS